VKPFIMAWSLDGVKRGDEDEVSEEENIMSLNDGSNCGTSTLSELFHDEGALLYLRGIFKEGGDSASMSHLFQFEIGEFKSTGADREYELGYVEERRIWPGSMKGGIGRLAWAADKEWGAECSPRQSDLRSR
jgi:hypothetical protein